MARENKERAFSRASFSDHGIHHRNSACIIAAAVSLTRFRSDVLLNTALAGPSMLISREVRNPKI